LKAERMRILWITLYGTKQAAAMAKVSQGLPSSKAKFLPSQGRSNLLFLTDDGKGFVGTHVDDLFPIQQNLAKVLRDRLWDVLSENMTITDEGGNIALKTRVEHPVGVTSQGAYPLRS
jgi:hypothetical protein